MMTDESGEESFDADTDVDIDSFKTKTDILSTKQHSAKSTGARSFYGKRGTQRSTPEQRPVLESATLPRKKKKQSIDKTPCAHVQISKRGRLFGSARTDPSPSQVLIERSASDKPRNTARDTYNSDESESECADTMYLNNPTLQEESREGRLTASTTPQLGVASTSTEGVASTCTEASNSDNPLLLQILTEVRESNKQLRMEVSELQKKVCGDEKSKSSSKKPSSEVRDAVRKVYKSLCEADENYGFHIDQPFTAQANQDAVKKLVSECKIYYDSSSATLKDAAQTYFVSLVGTSRLKESGKYKEKCKKQRRSNRIKRKLNKRVAALAKTKAIPEKEKLKWKEAFLPSLVSSEDSEEDGTFTVRPLPWRSEVASELFDVLDEKHNRKQSVRSKMMTFKRNFGLPSDREKPASGTVPGWCLKNC